MIVHPEASRGVQVKAEVMVTATAAVDAWKRREDPAAAAQRAEADELERVLPPKMDEFGRDENAARRDRAAARGKARSAALAPLVRRLAEDPAATLCDGTALAQVAAGGTGVAGVAAATAERQAYYARRTGELRAVAAATLEDVAPEFLSIVAVLRRVQDFKTRFPAQYGRAYVSEALPALMSVFVRLQLLEWDPLYVNGEDRGKAAPRMLHFEEHEWFRDLLEFSADGVCQLLLLFRGFLVNPLRPLTTLARSLCRCLCCAYQASLTCACCRQCSRSHVVVVHP